MATRLPSSASSSTEGECICNWLSLTGSIYFGLYDSLKPLLPSQFKGNPLANFCIGYTTTTLGALAA